MENNKDLMGWNAPGSDNNDKGGNNGPEKDPWGRTSRNNNQSDPVAALIKALKDLFGASGSGRSNKNSQKNSQYGLIPIIAIVALGFYIFSGFYTVKEAEKGVVLRLCLN